MKQARRMTSAAALLLMSSSACGIFKPEDETYLVEDLHEALQRHVTDVNVPRVSVHHAADTIRCFVPGQFDALSRHCVDGVLRLAMEGGFCVSARVLNASRVVYGSSSRVCIPMFETIAFDVECDGSSVVGAASLELRLVCGSVLLHIGDADDEHARAIADWVVGCQSVALEAERALGCSGGLISFLAHVVGVSDSVVESPTKLIDESMTFFAKIVWLRNELQPNDVSGMALAKSIDNAVLTLLGRRIFVSYFSESIVETCCDQTASFKNAVNRWFHARRESELEASARFGALVCATETLEHFSEVWSIVEQVLSRAPRNDLPPIDNAARQVALDAAASPNDHWRCVMLGGARIGAEQLPMLLDLVVSSPQLCVVDLTRVCCDAINAGFVIRLLSIGHMRFVSIAGMMQCDAIRASVATMAPALLPKLISSEDASCDALHRVYNDFRCRAWEASHELIAARLIGQLSS